MFTVSLVQAAFAAGYLDIGLSNLSTTRAAAPIASPQRSVAMFGPGTPPAASTPTTTTSTSRTSQPTEAEIVSTITYTFEVLTLLLVNSDIVAAAKSAGCVQACLDGYNRCARSASLQATFCKVRRTPPCVFFSPDLSCNQEFLAISASHGCCDSTLVLTAVDITSHFEFACLRVA